MSDVVQKAIIRGKLLIPPFELWIAVVAVYAGLAHFFPALASSGTERAVERQFPALVTVWCALYAAGGLVMILGLFRRSPRLEGAGLCLLASGVTVAMIASLASGAPILPVVVSQGGIVAACMARLTTLRLLA